MNRSMQEGQLPKGMTLPDPEPDVERTESGSLRVTSADVDYCKRIRDALDGVDGVNLHVVTLSAEEVAGLTTVVRIEIAVLPEGVSP